MSRLRGGGWLALAAPAVHPWYATWGLALIAVGADGRRRYWLSWLCVALCFTALPERLWQHPATVAGVLVLLAVAVGAVARPAPTTRGTGRARAGTP